ncbi:hypothetical protein TOPH_08968 [Tolypocladium ophioglossoides CBS 100239]|uniref:Uncharacterized protein n=1 Tax=Tolypocladium ophioglossoides (strain CBS 100239) TaxID=1163406 RepID=A0A0L0MX26_TOLOC|nr:hypothetical protein TOPH_08968 [Tolypocladium ophioglossoides CBS 100239]
MQSARDEMRAEYKNFEADAFIALYGRDFRKLTTKELIALSEKSTSVAKSMILENLKKSIALRTAITPFFPSRCPLHEYFIKVLERIVDNLKNVAHEADEAGKEISADEAIDRTVDENEFLLFLDELEGMVMMICDLWRGVEGQSLVMASLELLCPHWFDGNDWLRNIAPHAFIDDLKRSRNTFDTFRSQFYIPTFRAPSSLVPKVIMELLSSEVKRPGSLLSRVVMRILAATRSEITKNLRESVTVLCDYTAKCGEDIPGVLGNFSKLASDISSKAVACPDILSLGRLYAQLVVNLTQMFRLILDKPLVPALVHLYLNGRLCHKFGELEELERLCDDPVLAPALFWNGRPKTKRDLEQSVTNWICPAGPRVPIAVSISKNRYQDSILVIMGENGGVLDKKTMRLLGRKEKETIWETLASRIEMEIMIPDTAVVWKSALRTFKVLTKDFHTDEDENKSSEAALYMLSKISGQGHDETLCNLFLRNWEVERRKSPALWEIRRREL